MTLQEAFKLFDNEEYDSAFPVIKEYAEQGDAVAQRYFAYMYEYAKGVEQDYVKAFEWFTKSAEQGDSAGQRLLGNMYEEGKGVEQDYVKAVGLYTKSAEQGNRIGQWCLGHMYYAGKGVEQDYGKAAEWYTKSAEQGNAVAQRHLGYMYEEDKGVEQDYAKAIEWYTKSAEQGDSDAQWRLGQMYEYGKGVEQDYVKAVEWHVKSAEQGNSIGQFRLGQLYEFGYGVEQNYVKAKELYTKSAEQGNSQAQKRLANMYKNGKGVAQDYGKAVEWYTKSAEQGYSEGQFSLGSMYEAGKGVAQDYSKAVEWYEKAAEQGDELALAALGRVYENGTGVEQDYAKAVELYTQAADYGQPYLALMYYFGNGVEKSRGKAIEFLNSAIEWGSSYAQWLLGVIYKAENDYGKALECFEAAFAEGDIDSAISIGDLYKDGMGVEQNGEKAKEYYLQADEVDGLYSLGNLYLQGCEGIEQNVETAYEYFKKAKAKGKDCSLSIEMCEKYLGIAKDDSRGIREFADKVDAIDSGTYDIVDNELRSDFGDIWDSLQDETKADLRTGLLEYTILYKLYKDKDVDFSAAISPITKAFEIVLARFFCRDFVKFLKDNNVNPSLYRRYPFLVDRETGKFHADTDSFTLGSFCNLIAGDKLLRQMERQQPMIKDAMRKGEIKYVSFDKKITSSVDKNVIAYVENILFKDTMKGATENYLLGLAQEVSFVSDIYRNPAMHKKKMGLAVAESCGNCLIKVKKIIYHFVEHIDFEKIKQESYKIKYDVDLFLGDKKVDVSKPALQVGDVIDLQITDIDDRHLGKFDKDGNTYNVVLQYRR